MTDYADAADFTTWTGVTAPAGITRILRAAGRRVDQMLLTAVYDVDSTTGLPTDADVLAVLRDATCEQAAYQVAIGDPYGVGTAGLFSSFSIGGLSATRGKSASATGGSSSGVPPRFSTEAYEILQQAGLTGMSPLTPV